MMPTLPLGPGQIPPYGLDEVEMQPGTVAGLDLTGCVAVRQLADGRLLALEPLLFGSARLCVGRPEIMIEEGSLGGWDDTWDFQSALAGLVALATWEPAAQVEPDGWYRHFATSRRRPGGDPTLEVVQP